MCLSDITAGAPPTIRQAPKQLSPAVHIDLHCDMHIRLAAALSTQLCPNALECLVSTEQTRSSQTGIAFCITTGSSTTSRMTHRKCRCLPNHELMHREAAHAVKVVHSGAVHWELKVGSPVL